MSRETARYSYTESSSGSQGSAIVYDDDTSITIHSDSCPARGTHSSFDLTRIHRFGHLDKDVSPGTLMGDRPSYKAMIEWASGLPAIRAARARVEFENLGPLPAAENDGWLETGSRFAILDHDTMMKRPRLIWIVPGVLPKAELAIIYGESGSGKSFLALDLAAAIQRGIVWRGNGEQCMQGNVLIIAAEGADGMRNRAEAYAIKHPETPTRLLPSFMTEAPDFLQRAEKGKKDVEIIAERVLTKYGRGGLLAIIVDTANAVTTGANSNSSEDMGTLIGNCKYLHRITGATVVLIDHSPISTKDRISGWSGKKGACDAQIQVERDGDARSWHTAKMKDGLDDKVKHHFRLAVVNLREVDDTSCVVEHVEAPKLSGTGKQRATGRHQVAMYDALKEMAPSGTVNYEDLMAAYAMKMPKGDGRDRRGRDGKAALEGLIGKKLAYMHAGNCVSLSSLVTGPAFDDDTVTDLGAAATIASTKPRAAP